MCTSVRAHDKVAIGWLEKASIYPSELVLIAKLDTGAKNSSLNASHIIEFTRDDERWVRFVVADRTGHKVSFERKVHRAVRIKTHGVTPQSRVVVILGICLGAVYKEVEVNLIDRSDFNYPLLLGRSFIAGHFVIDPSRKFTTKPLCRGKQQP